MSRPYMAGTGPGTVLDPRVAVLAVMVVGAFVLAVGTEEFEVLAVLIACACLLSTRRWWAACAVLAVEALILSFTHLAPGASGRQLSTLVVFALSFTFRFVLAGVIAVSLIGQITTGQAQAMLRWARVPRILAVPVMVALRFLPVVVDDARTITDNLMLRGMISSPAALVIHPVVAVRYAVLPLVASSLRTGDELAATALLRGLGASSRPSSVVTLRLRWVDYVVLAATGAVVVAGLVA